MLTIASLAARLAGTRPKSSLVRRHLVKKVHFSRQAMATWSGRLAQAVKHHLLRKLQYCRQSLSLEHPKRAKQLSPDHSMMLKICPRSRAPHRNSPHLVPQPPSSKPNHSGLPPHRHLLRPPSSRLKPLSSSPHCSVLPPHSPQARALPHSSLSQSPTSLLQLPFPFLPTVHGPRN